MFIDVIVVILLVIAFFKGISKGLIIGIFSFLAIIIGLAAAIKLSAIAAAYLGNNVNISQRWLPVIAFVVVFIVVLLLVRLSAKALENVVQMAMLGWLNRLGGIFFFSLIYLFIFSIILFYANNLNLLNKETVQDSITFPYLQPLAPKIINGLGILLPFLKNMFAELNNFFENIAHKAGQ
jgi:membrane protein required for colicin V production